MVLTAAMAVTRAAAAAAAAVAAAAPAVAAVTAAAAAAAAAAAEENARVVAVRGGRAGGRRAVPHTRDEGAGEQESGRAKGSAVRVLHTGVGAAVGWGGGRVRNPAGWRVNLIE